MKRNLLLSGLVAMILSSANAQKDLYIQEASEDYSQVQKIMKPLSLSTVLEQGMRKNFQEHIRKNTVQILSNDLDDAKESFYFPKVNLVLNSGKHRIGTLKNGSRDSGRISKRPSGSFGLELGEYSVFNWGKDYLSYLNTREALERGIETKKENSRNFRQDLIEEYIRIIYLKKVVSIRREQLRNASFVYRMNREKLTLKKISKHDYYQARSEYLRSQQEYFEAKLRYEYANEEMATLIDDPPGTQYIIEEDYKYTKIKMSKKNALGIGYQNAPFIKTAKLEKNTSIRNHEIALKDNLPLPKVTMNLGSYKHFFNSNSSKTLYETESGSNNIELVASVSATWNIFGDGGIFNKRKLANSKLVKENTSWSYNFTRRTIERTVIKIYQTFQNIQDKMKILDARIPSLKKRLDLALDNYLERKGRYNDFHLALVELFDTEVSQASLKFEYLMQKIQLAQIIGVEDLPGETFDSIVNVIDN